MRPKKVRDGCMTGCPRKFGNGFRKNFGSRSPGHNPSMNWLVRLTAVALLFSMCAATPGAQALAVQTSGPAQGCHSHPTVPSPARYQCCANGHNWAITASPVAVQAPVAVDWRVEFDLLSFDTPQGAVFAFLAS